MTNIAWAVVLILLGVAALLFTFVGYVVGYKDGVKSSPFSEDDIDQEYRKLIEEENRN